MARIYTDLFKVMFSINIDSFSNLSWNILVAVALHNMIGLFLGFLIASFFKLTLYSYKVKIIIDNCLDKIK